MPKPASRFCLAIEFPAGIDSDGGPFSSFFGCRKIRSEKIADSSLRRRVSRAGLAELIAAAAPLTGMRAVITAGVAVSTNFRQGYQ